MKKQSMLTMVGLLLSAQCWAAAFKESAFVCDESMVCEQSESATKIASETGEKKRFHAFLLDLSFNFMVSRALYVAADLGIADLLHQQPLTLSELAQQTQTDDYSLGRLLRLLQLYDIFGRDEQGRYYNTGLSDYMRADHTDSMLPLLLHEDETRWNSYGHLGYSIKTGQPAFNELYGMPYFDYTKKHPQLNQRFNKAMTTISNSEEASIAQSYPFSSFSIVADIGGGRGGMLSKILKAHPSVHGILCDLPEVVKDHGPLLEFSERFDIHPGSFFEPIAFNADLFVVKRILHDWDDQKVVEILKNIASAMNPDSRLLIIEALLGGNEKEKDKFVAQVDLLLLSIFGGAERTLEDFKRLITSAGLTIRQVYSTDSMLSIIECAR